MRRVIASLSMRSFECTLATTTSTRASMLVVVIERTVVEDVDLDAGQDPERCELLVQRGDDVELLEQSLALTDRSRP